MMGRRWGVGPAPRAGLSEGAGMREVGERGWWWCGAVVLALLGAACGRGEAGGGDAVEHVPGVAAADVVTAGAEPQAVVAPEAPVDPEVARLLAEVRERQRCNRVTGCPAMTGLLQRVPAAIGPVSELLRAQGRGDGYWIEALLDFLGQSDRPEALETLAPFARDRRWAPRLRAAVAIGRLHRHATELTRDVVREGLKMAEASGDTAWLAALLMAQARLEPARAGELEARLLSLYPTDPAAIRQIPPPVLDWLVMVATEARLSRAAPLLRGACLSDNRFVAISALTGVAAQQDTGAVPFALSRLDDVQPGVRRAAMLALQTITGSRTIDTAADWRAWAVREGLSALPAEWAAGWPAAPVGGAPGGVSPSGVAPLR
jgi:hypothetical protein